MTCLQLNDLGNLLQYSSYGTTDCGTWASHINYMWGINAVGNPLTLRH